MEKYKSFFSESEYMETDDKVKYFYDRTNLHRSLVAKYGYRLVEILEQRTGRDFQQLTYNIKHHDDSKFKEPEIEPYILITWNYYCKDHNIELQLTDEQNKFMNEGTTHHVKFSRHHPEFWSDRKDVIPKNDRDKFNPDDVPTIEIHNMPFIYLCEMVADWCAMSEEKGTNTPREWADRVLNKRWKFSDKQTKQIYTLIDLIW